MYLIWMVYACLISCSLINKSKCHSLAYFNLHWTCVVILHNIYFKIKRFKSMFLKWLWYVSEYIPSNKKFMIFISLKECTYLIF